MEKTAKIYVAGHRGLAGGAIVRVLRERGYSNLVYRTFNEMDLCDSGLVEAFFRQEKPEYVFLAAAKVGGIIANNTYPAEFIYSNLSIQTNVIHNSWKSGVKRLLFLGTSCIYPKECPQPMREEHLLSGPLEKTNEPYAVAKIAGIKMCESYNRQYGTEFICVMPTNLMGPGDNYHPQNSHVFAALIRKFHEAKLSGSSQETLWGTGTPLREFLYSEDMARACIHLMESPKAKVFQFGFPLFNVGAGKEISIEELAELIMKTVGFTGKINWDNSKPDGTMKKMLDSSRMRALGWEPQISLTSGIKLAYEDFQKFAQ